MDIETTMKINNLMRELKKHGIAVSSEDAYSKAEHLVALGEKTPNSQQKSEYEMMFDKKQENTETKTEEKEEELKQKNKTPQTNSALIQKQVEIMIQMQTKSMRDKIGELQNTLSTMQTEIMALRNELNTVKSMRIEGISMDKKTKQAASAPSQKVLGTEEKKEEPKKQKHPRQGEFQPGCIDIKKYFYYGSR